MPGMLTLWPTGWAQRTTATIQTHPGIAALGPGYAP